MIAFRCMTLILALSGCCAWAGAWAAGMPPEQAPAAAQAESQSAAAPAPASAEAHGVSAQQERGAASGSPAQGAPAAGEGMH